MKKYCHCVYELTYHLVLVTKYRKKCICQPILNELKDIFSTQLEKWECELIEFNGEEDHIHILFNAHPTIQLSKLVNSLKTVSSRVIRKKYHSHLVLYYWKPCFWTKAYCLISTGGTTIQILKNYIENQGKGK